MGPGVNYCHYMPGSGSYTCQEGMGLPYAQPHHPSMTLDPRMGQEYLDPSGMGHEQHEFTHPATPPAQNSSPYVLPHQHQQVGVGPINVQHENYYSNSN
jgi:hypothetical protein